MPDSGWHFAASAISDSAVGTLVWIKPGDVTQTGGEASAHNTSGDPRTTHYLRAEAPAALVPAGSTILGIELRAFFYIQPGADVFSEVRLTKAGAIGTVNRAASPSEFEELPFHDRFVFGGAADLWGEAWTAEELNDGLGAVLQTEVADDADAHLKSVEFRVHYDPPPAMTMGLVEGRGEGRTPGLRAGSRLTLPVSEGVAQGLAPALISAFARWLSPPYSLDPLRIALSSVIAWDETLPADTAVTVETRIGDGPWQEAVNGQSVPGLAAEADLQGKALAVRVTLTTTALPATPRFGNLQITAAGALGLSQGFTRNPLTGDLIPNSQALAVDEGEETFNHFVFNPVARSIYDAPEQDIGFDDRVRVWAGVQSELGPGEAGLVETRGFVAHRTEAGSFGAMAPLTIEEATLRFARSRLELGNTGAVALLSQFTPTIDLLERRVTRTIQVAAGGSAVVFDAPFHRLPGVEISPAAVGGVPRFGGWENLTANGVTLHVFDGANVSVGGEATYTITGV